MKKLFLLLALAAVCVSARAQMFTADQSTQDITVNYGITFPMTKNTAEQQARQYVAINYTANFWRSLAVKVGVQGQQSSTYKAIAGLPVGIAYRPGVRSWDESIGRGVENAVANGLFEASAGQTQMMTDNLLWDLALILFRRTEFYAGFTPGYCFGPYNPNAPGDLQGNRFWLTGDLGVVFSIPIWHLTLNVPIAYHYSIFHNENDLVNKAHYHYLSIGLGLGWLF